MTHEETVLVALVERVRQAARYNANEEVAPIAVLWPDPSRQWEAVVPRLREHLPILTLGPLDTSTATGPAIWIRSHLATAAFTEIPVIYLPGIKRRDLLPTDEIGRDVALLAYLPGSGMIWTHPNGREWTVLAFLQGGNGGLELPIDGGTATREALRAAFPLLLDRSVGELRTQTSPITAAWLHGLLLPDLPRAVLEWLNDPAAYQAACSPEQWEAFDLRLKRGFGIDLQRDTIQTAARALGEHISPDWQVVWQRWCEAPENHPQIPGRLRSARPTTTMAMFVDSTDIAWPQDNDQAESDLRQALLEVATLEPGPARQSIQRLETDHAPRRRSVWAKLGKTPLATALDPLSRLAASTAIPLAGTSLSDIITQYAQSGWQADAAALEALRSVDSQADLDAIVGAVRAVYLDWLSDGANTFQARFQAAAPGQFALPDVAPGTCLLFADGLRLDVAQLVAEQITARGLATNVEGVLGPLPGVTPTAKPAVSPIAALLHGGNEFTTCPPGKATPLTKLLLENLLRSEGWTVLAPGETACPAPTARGWTELGTIDSYGHSHGLDLAREVPRQAQQIAQRTADLLAAGWSRVQIITDHGWLLMPGGLPKSSISLALTDGSKNRKGRCVRLATGSTTDLQTVPWQWDSAVRIAMAPGIQCFSEGVVYDHGGLSPQESVIPIVTVGTDASASADSVQVAIAAIIWKGLWCTVTASPRLMGLLVDMRSRPADASSSLLDDVGVTDTNGRVRVAADSGYEGVAAYVVISDQSGTILTQQDVVVGGEA